MRFCGAREKRRGAAELGETAKRMLEEQPKGVRAEKPVFKKKKKKRLVCVSVLFSPRVACFPPCSPLYPGSQELESWDRAEAAGRGKERQRMLL